MSLWWFVMVPAIKKGPRTAPSCCGGCGYAGTASFFAFTGGIRLALPALDDRFILIVDDWNWQGVRHGTCLAIAEANLTVHYSLEVLTTQDDTHPEEKDTGKESAWHNGYFVCVCTKPGVATRPKAV